MFPSLYRHDPTLRSPFTNHSHYLSLTSNSCCTLKATTLLASAAPQLQSMEQVDDQPPPTEAQVQHHHENNNNNNHYHSTKPLTTSTTAIASYFPQQEQLDFPLMYSGLLFNPNTLNNHHQSYPDAADGGTGTTASTYLTVAPGLLKSCSDGSEANAAFNYTSNTCSSRWPREETMSLLQIRSGLHSSFKQATHKGPLWDEVSRIMYEEHGYQRSGKKCREKFENLYKYYKKTKEAKSVKHDGKNYRFFRQLEALYGDQIAAQPTTVISSQTQFPPNLNDQVMMMRSSSHLLGNSKEEVSPNNQLQHMKLPCDQSCLSLSNHNSSSHFTSSSSEDNNKRVRDKKNKLKMKVKGFIGTQMKSLYEQQQLCMEKVLETIEQKEKERVVREEKWRQQAEDRLEKEQKLWANERAWMKERDATLMETLQQFTSGRSLASSHILQQVPASSSSYTQPMSLMNKKQTDQSCSVRDPLTLYNKESQDRWCMASNHHHNQHHDGVSGFRAMISDGNNVGNGGSMLWDGSSFGLKLNNGDGENQQN